MVVITLMHRSSASKGSVPEGFPSAPATIFLDPRLRRRRVALGTALRNCVAAFVQVDALVERHVAALEPSHHAFELA